MLGQSLKEEGFYSLEYQGFTFGKYCLASLILFFMIFWGKEIFARDLNRDSSQLDVSYYFDNREYNTLNIQTSTNKLPLDIFLWGFIDIHSDQNKNRDRFDLTRYFFEYRFSRAVGFGIDGLRWEMEYNDSNGSDNSLVRFGMTYKHALPFLVGQPPGFLR